MSEFLKFAYEFISRIIYNLAELVVGLFSNFIKLFFGFGQYDTIRQAYFANMGFGAKILSILLILICIAIPVFLIVLLIKRIKLRIELKAQADDNMTLYKEIGRLNKQVLNLMDEKNMILAMKSGVASSAALQSYAEASGMFETEQGPEDPLANPIAVAGVPGGDGAVIAAGGATATLGGLDEETITSAVTAATVAAAKAKAEAQEEEHDNIFRFPKLRGVDQKYEEYDAPELNTTITLEQFAEGYRKFAASQLHLYYTPEIVRRYIAGMASSRVLILEGISGTGKTSLPYAISRYMDYPATIVSVQPSYRDKTELLGYFNEFSKRFNETEFLRALYEANYRGEPSFIVLDEMNLARIEYYFAELLSVLEMPSRDEWVIDLVPTAWSSDPVLLHGGKITVPENIWFVGTANNDDSTFTITDKVYDRAIPIEINQRADAFECEIEPRCRISSKYLEELFEKAKDDYPISEATLAKMVKFDQYLQTRFKLSFGNRIVKQMYDFIPVYVACGGTELDGMDYIIARKVLKKFESQNISYVRDEIKALIQYLDKTFGETNMNDSREYLQRIQNYY